MLTDVFYQHLAGMLQGGPHDRGPLSIAIGRGEAGWDRTPPVLRRDRAALTREVVRKEVDAKDIQYVDAADGLSKEPTSRLRIQASFLAGEGEGTLRECGLWAGQGAEALLLAYFVHPRVEKSPDGSLLRSILLDLSPGRIVAEETPTQFLGNSKQEEVHDLAKSTKACQLDEIRVDRRHYFNSVDEALALGYDRCAFCFGRNQSDR